MCGICGLASIQSDQIQTEEAVIRRMTQTLQHRGPDSDGFYLNSRVMLGMRRLSIIDLDTGEQPITNEDGTVVVIFNGEIYNFRSLRRALENKGHHFRTQSDTEVIVHAYEEYGERCLEHLNGMFAIAIWDRRYDVLFLARDRLGIKPLFYWHDSRHLVFGSEIKAVLAHPAAPREIDLSALDAFLSVEYIAGSQTIYSGIRKLQPGHYLKLHDGQVDIVRYWNIRKSETPQDEAACIEHLTELIDDAVRMRMVSDVPLGAFLSGGIDSSTVLAFMSRHSTQPVRTFSIGFDDVTYNELPIAAQVADFFQTDHSFRVLDPDVRSMAFDLVGQFDEPFGDFSIFPTFLVSRLAREHVKVVLTGDGGDEVFGGYDTYVAQWLSRYYRWVPESVRTKILPALMAQFPPQAAKKGLINKAKRWVEGAALPDNLQHVRWMIFSDLAQKDRLYSSEFKTALGKDASLAPFEAYFEEAAGFNSLGQQQYVDIKTYLAEDILTKVDRMSMATSLEARVPLLDYRIVEFAVNLPAHMKLRKGQTKWILRQAMAPHLPSAVLRKPKQGFSIPMKHWLTGPLKPMMQDLLSPAALQQHGYFEAATVQQWMDEHLKGKVNHSHRLWGLIVFQIWMQQSNQPAAV